MKHLETNYQTHDGLNLYLQSWMPEQPKAAVFLIHGLGEHSTRYSHLAEKLVEQDISVFTFDGRGHGKSSTPAPTAYFENYEDYLKDIDALWGKVTSYTKGLPVFILGHSMGGALAAAYVLKYSPNAKGAILLGAALKPADNVSKLLIAVSSLVSKITPKLKVLKLDPYMVSHDMDVVRDYMQDPLVYTKPIPARTGYEVLRMMRRIEEKASEFKLPVLIMHGGDDHLTNPKGSEEFFKKAGSEDKTLIPYPGLYHELINELEKEEVMKRIVSWVVDRIGE
jgi:alpha-beta hydrolase superfamily lysophospholipase